MRRGSALIMALWIIAVLSIMVLSFATEAHMQTGINIYVRERNRVNRLVDAGQILAEVVLVDYKNVSDWVEGEDEQELFEDDRWYKEKRALKNDSKCTIGPILLDEEDEDSGTVTIDIELSESGGNGININELFAGGTDKSYQLRWQMILRLAGIPEDLEVSTSDGERHTLMNLLVASWNDWRDEDDSVTSGPLEDGTVEDGAESQWYEEYDEDNDVADEDKRRPRNGSIPDINELEMVRGFYDFPSVLHGGLLYDNLPETKETRGRKKDRDKEEESEDNPRFAGIFSLGVLGVSGSSKVNANDCTVNQLLTVPGIFDEEEDEDDMTESRERAQAIIDTLSIMPDYDVDERLTRWPYKDFNDLCQRVSDEFDVDIGSEASQYLIFKPDDKSEFRVTITGESMGMKHKVRAKCYVKDNKVRYTEWRED